MNKTVSRCWMPHYCVGENCTVGQLANKGFTVISKRILYEIGLPMIMHFVCIVFTALAIRGELKKRKTHKESQGKVLFMETARKKKSKQHIFYSVAHLGASILLSLLYFPSRNVLFFSTTRENQRFAYLLTGVVAYNFLGLFHVIIYLSIKRTQIEDSFSSLLERHSLRKSIRSVRNVPLVSGGYKPKTSAISTGLSASANTTDFGIYMGCAEDMEDEVNEEEANSKSLSFSFTQKIDTSNEKTSLSTSEELK